MLLRLPQVMQETLSLVDLRSDQRRTISSSRPHRAARCRLAPRRHRRLEGAIARGWPSSLVTRLNPESNWP